MSIGGLRTICSIMALRLLARDYRSVSRVTAPRLRLRVRRFLVGLLVEWDINLGSARATWTYLRLVVLTAVAVALLLRWTVPATFLVRIWSRVADRLGCRLNWS